LSAYIHHVAGRLRLKLSSLKRNAGRAERAQNAIRQIKGVISVDANTVTGSLLIYYEAADIEFDSFMESLEKTIQQLGLLPATDLRCARPSSTATSVLTDKIIGVLVEKMIERSAVAIVGTLL
jgi:hypothetical protein